MQQLELADGTLSYDIAGEGQPVVLIHAGIADNRMWDAQVADFAQHHHVVRYDMRGFGGSPLPNGRFTCSEDLDAIVIALALPPVWIVAASFGARVAVDFALAQPRKVAGLVLVAPAVSGMPDAPELATFEEEEAALVAAGRLDEAAELNVRTWVDGPQRNTTVVPTAIREQVAAMQKRSFVQPVPPNVGLDWFAPQASERLHELRMPMLVIAGELDQPSFVAYGKQIARQVTGAQHVVVPNTAHLLNMEQPTTFNETALQFIDAAGRT